VALSPLQTETDPAANVEKTGNPTDTLRLSAVHLPAERKNPAIDPQKLGLRRRKKRVAARLDVRLDYADTKMTRRLCQAYGKDASALFRDMIRERYAALYETVIEPEDVGDGDD